MAIATLTVMLSSPTIVLTAGRATDQTAHGSSSDSFFLLPPCVNGLAVDVNGGADPSGSATSIDWNWGDGVQTTQWFIADHEYSSPGPYTIIATAHFADGGSLSATASVTVGSGLLTNCNELTISAGAGGDVRYSASVGSGTVPAGSSTNLYLASEDDLNLYAQANAGDAFSAWTVTGTITTGGGVSLPLSNPDILAVVDSSGTLAASFVANPFSVAIAIVSPSTSVSPAPAAITFQGTVTAGNPGPSLSWDWSVLSSTETASGASPTLYFPNIGSYDVLLTATDPAGAIASASTIVTITSPSTVQSVTVATSPSVNDEQGVASTITVDVLNDQGVGVGGQQVSIQVAWTDVEGQPVGAEATLSGSSLLTGSDGLAQTTLVPLSSSLQDAVATITATSAGVAGTGQVLFVTENGPTTWQTDPSFQVASSVSSASVPVPASIDSSWIPQLVTLYANVTELTPAVGTTPTAFESKAQSYFGFTPTSLSDDAEVVIVAIGGLSPIAKLLDSDAATLGLQGGFRSAISPYLDSNGDLLLYLNLQLGSFTNTLPGFTQTLADAGLSALKGVSADPLQALDNILSAVESALMDISLDFGVLAPTGSGTFYPVAHWSLSSIEQSVQYLINEVQTITSQLDSALSCGLTIGGAVAEGGLNIISDVQAGVTCLDMVLDLVTPSSNPFTEDWNWFTAFVDPNGTTIVPELQSGSGSTVLGYDPSSGSLIWGASAGFILGGNGFWMAVLNSTQSVAGDVFGLIGVGPEAHDVPFTTDFSGGPASSPAIATGVLHGGQSARSAVTNATVGVNSPLSWVNQTALVVSSVTKSEGKLTVTGELSEDGTPSAGTVDIRDGQVSLGSEAVTMDGSFEISVPAPHQSFLLTVEGSANGTVGTAYSQWVTIASYTLSFDETGLPAGSTWGVTLNGSTEYTTSSELSFAAYNGTYPYSIAPPPGFSSSPSFGSLVIHGSNTLVLISFTRAYSVSFAESGLSSGSSWFVNLGDRSWFSVGATIEVQLSNGTYPYRIGGAPGYSATPSMGLLTVSGANSTLLVSFSQITYSITLAETGIPATILELRGWDAVVGGVEARSYSAQVTYVELNGTYPYVISGPSGYRVNSPTPSGIARVSGVNLTEDVSFVKGGTYKLTVAEKGLRMSQRWCVNLAGWKTCTTTARAAYTNLTPARYNYSVLSPTAGQRITLSIGGSSMPLAGSLALSKDEKLSLSFVYSYFVTFHEVTSGSASWSVTIDGVTKSNASFELITFRLPNGTYTYRVSRAPGYSVKGSPPRVKVDGGPVTVSVRYTAKRGSTLVLPRLESTGRITQSPAARTRDWPWTN